MREKAQQLLVEVMKAVGKETVLTTGCRDMKPAAMRALKPLLSKVCETVESTEAAGMTKTAAAKQTLQSINPDVIFEEYTLDITRTTSFEQLLDRIRHGSVDGT
ncbi:hypothetical protein PsorP6_015992 [Peronosclerospora sorghi]|uniref:Uncharacterized protein n=1 Tax=Peronosclerospora sorghi TaxID=230839 RepID=A0ACC0WPF8_9STRA|nr:hypothetical protein PsorP6_015992 [Peronosclerospora sorghi]